MQQVALERLPVADYEGHADVAVHAATLQLQLEGPLQVGGVVFVLHVPPESWRARQGNARADFFVSTREVLTALTSISGGSSSWFRGCTTARVYTVLRVHTRMCNLMSSVSCAPLLGVKPWTAMHSFRAKSL